MWNYSVEVDYMNHSGKYDMFAYRCDSLEEAMEQYKHSKAHDFNNYYSRCTLEIRLVSNVGDNDKIIQKNTKVWRPIGGHALSL